VLLDGGLRAQKRAGDRRLTRRSPIAGDDLAAFRGRTTWRRCATWTTKPPRRKRT
jgi:hypothetical protein